MIFSLIGLSNGNYNRNVNIVTQDSRLLFVFKINITIPFILIRKSFLSHDNFSSSNTVSRRLQDVSEGVKLYVMTRNCYVENIFKMSSRYVLKTSSGQLGDQTFFAVFEVHLFQTFKQYSDYERLIAKILDGITLKIIAATPSQVINDKRQCF